MQASVSYISIHEQYGQRIRPLLVGGVQYDNTGAVEHPAKPLSEVGRDETFPLYEERSVRPNPIGLRHTFPGQAIGLKMTANYIGKLASETQEEEMMVLNEVGVDQFDIVLDSNAWCRALRFAMNVDGGGYDPRWHSGDYSEYLTTDMMLHPSVPLKLEDCVQSTKQFFLDENDFVSSDLFNATLRVTNVSLRIPAAINDDLRACDILVKSNEIMLTISSALPRTLVHTDEKNEAIEFPNDPSDAVFALEKAEDPSNRQRGIMTSKAMSTFRFQITFRGLALQLAPVIPLNASRESQHLLMPIEMTMLFCFEGEPPDLSSGGTLSRLVMFTSVLAHRFVLNVDFDLITAAAITLCSHFDNVLKTAAACSDLFVTRSSVATSEIGCADGRITNTLQGRKVLVRRQILRSRETGGLIIACSLNVDETSVRIWRQNVPRKLPLCSTVADTGEYAPSLRLMDYSLQGVDLAVEATLCQDKRCLLMKFSVTKMFWKICEFGRLLQMDSFWVAAIEKNEDGRQDTCAIDDMPMANIFTFGSVEPERRAVVARIEEAIDSTRSWTLAAEFASGHIDCRVEEIETFTLLVLTALLQPGWTWEREPIENKKPRIFPRTSVGAFLMSLLPDLPSFGDGLPTDVEETPVLRDGSVGLFAISKVDQVMKSLLARVAPVGVDLLLLRVGWSDVFIRTSAGNASSLSPSEGIGLRLWELNFLLSYISSDTLSQASLLENISRKQDKWSSFKSHWSEGICHSLKSRQSFLISKSDGSGGAGEEVLVEPFDFGYSYGDKKISLLMSDDLSICDVDNLDDFFVVVFYSAGRWKEFSTKTFTILNLLNSNTQNEDSDATIPEPQANPIILACSSTVASLRSFKTWFHKVNELTHASDKLSKSLLFARDKEIGDLRLLVFTKEKERLGALALISSEAAGWLRLGTAQRIGQRGMMSCMLWPHWSVLRRSLLMTYAGPGQVRFIWRHMRRCRWCC